MYICTNVFSFSATCLPSLTAELAHDDQFAPDQGAMVTEGADRVLNTLVLVFGEHLPIELVRDAHEAEPEDLKCCVEVLWELLPQVRRITVLGDISR